MDASTSLLQVLNDPRLIDPRRARGLRHPLPAISASIATAMLTGITSRRGAVQLARALGRDSRRLLGHGRRAAPSEATLRRVLRSIDAAAFERLIAEWIAARLGRRHFAHVARDGKTARGSRDGDLPAAHLLAAYASEVGAPLARLRAESKTDEHEAAPELLGVLPPEGEVVTGDAMFPHRDVGSAVVAGGGHYVLPAEEDQPTLPADIRAAFDAPPAGLSPRQAKLRAASIRSSGHLDKGHGRVERRTIRTTTWLNGYLDRPSVGQVFHLRRERTVGGETSVDEVYGVTSLGAEGASPARLPGLIRSRWSIENRLFGVRDGALGEDASRVRAGAAAQVAAAVRDVAVFLLGKLARRQKQGIADVIRDLRFHVHKAIKLVTT